jgi:hypothetical protein
MDPKRLIIILLALSCAGFLYRLKQPQPLFGHGSVRVAAGVILAPSTPVQSDAIDADQFALDDATVTPLANFEFETRLISIKWYHDRESRYSPVDLGVGWGRLSDSAVIDALEWSHSSRFLMFRWLSKPPLPAEEITRSMANIHVIPANARVLARIGKLKIGQRVKGRGKLVELRSDNGFQWRSSLTRTDSGAGACEILYLESIEVL